MQISSFLVAESFANQPKLAFLDGRCLTSEMIDYCGDRDYDWIGLLQPERKIELYRLSLPGTRYSSNQRSQALEVSDLVKLTLQATYQEITVSQNQYWSYTCSLQMTGFGKVRFVAYFSNALKKGPFVVLISNRLDWSASKILKRWLHHHSASPLTWQFDEDTHFFNSSRGLGLLQTAGV